QIARRVLERVRRRGRVALSMIAQIHEHEAVLRMRLAELLDEAAKILARPQSSMQHECCTGGMRGRKDLVVKDEGHPAIIAVAAGRPSSASHRAARKKNEAP